MVTLLIQLKKRQLSAKLSKIKETKNHMKEMLESCERKTIYLSEKQPCGYVLIKVFLKICSSKFTGEHPCRSVISNLQPY